MDHDGREAFGSWYDDYTVGDIYKHWPGRTVNEYDDTLFSMITMNHAPLHIDEHYMSGSQFGQRLVNGLFVISLVVGMTVREISGKAIANLEYETIKHLGPTFHGDTIYAETEILEKRESKSKNDRGILYVETRAWNQRDETILTLRRRVMIPKRGEREVVRRC